MGRLRITTARLGIVGAAGVVVGGALLGMAASASAASPTIMLTQTAFTTPSAFINITGSGFPKSSTGFTFECPLVSGEPTIAPGVGGAPLPVGCGNIEQVKTNKKGDITDASLGSSYTVMTGLLGPPGAGTDSSGGDAATDALSYPTPPTAGQSAGGATSQILVAFGASEASATITFSFSSTTTTTTLPTGCTPKSGTVTSGSASATVNPATCLSNGTQVTVTASGLHASSLGSIEECNNDPSQPTISFLGNNIPVSCWSPTTYLFTTSGSGTIPATKVTVKTGVLGPPTTGTDSSGGSAAVDAQKYPCPPTAAQVAAGDSCVLAVGDEAGDQLAVPISFASGGGGGTTTTTTTTTMTPPPPPTCKAESHTASATKGQGTATVDPATCLGNGTSTEVSAKGLSTAKGTTGAVLECNGDTSQPTVSFAGENIPVSCTSVTTGIVMIGANGSFDSKFVVHEGVLGPPTTGTDSAGHSAAADAADYPCPPTAAQQKAGITCDIAVGDVSGDEIPVPISFASSSSSATTSTTTGPATGASSGASTTSSTSSSSTSSSSLAFTGAGPGVWTMGIVGLVLIALGGSVLLLADAPRRALRFAVHKGAHLRGRRS